MRRILLAIVAVASVVAGGATPAAAVEYDELTCSGPASQPVTLTVGYNSAGLPDIECTRVNTSPFKVTITGTGSGLIEQTFLGTCTAGASLQGTISVTFDGEDYVLTYVVAFTNGAGTLVITDGSSDGGADEATGSGTLNTLPCCPAPISCQQVATSLTFTATLHALI